MITGRSAQLRHPINSVDLGPTHLSHSSPSAPCPLTIHVGIEPIRLFILYFDSPCESRLRFHSFGRPNGPIN